MTGCRALQLLTNLTCLFHKEHKPFLPLPFTPADQAASLALCKRAIAKPLMGGSRKLNILPVNIRVLGQGTKGGGFGGERGFGGEGKLRGKSWTNRSVESTSSFPHPPSNKHTANTGGMQAAVPGRIQNRGCVCTWPRARRLWLDPCCPLTSSVPSGNSLISPCLSFLPLK